MNIRIKQTKDHIVIAKLNESVQTLHYELYPNDFKKFDLNTVTKAFKRILSSSHTFAFLASKNSEPVGYLLCMLKTRKENEFQFKKKALYIDQLSINEKYRKQGIGKELMTKALVFAKELEVEEIELNHWVKNEEASNFFKQIGFEYYNYNMKK